MVVEILRQGKHPLKVTNFDTHPNTGFMRRKALIFVFVVSTCLQSESLLAQVSHDLSVQYFQLYAQTSLKAADRVNDFIRFSKKLEDKQQGKDDVHFLKSVFTKTHKEYLRIYDVDASFSQLIDEGKYNCLTGTAIYGLLLTHLRYDFRIIETNYHIFLVVNCATGKIIFEATDPVMGFISDQSVVEKRLKAYEQNSQRSNTTKDKNIYSYNFQLFDEVSLKEMLGLLHYNEAVKAFNDHQLPTTVFYLDRAIRFYFSPRLDEFSRIVLLSLHQSKLEASIKENCVKRVQTLRQMKIAGVASPIPADF
jgi:hypothetical protein